MTAHLTRVALAAAVAAAGAGLLQAQEAPGRRLAVDFKVFGPAGNLLDTLSPDDVELRIDGKVRGVKALRRVVAGARAVTTDAGLRQPFGTNADAAGGRTFLVILDEDSFRTGREEPFRNALTGLLSRMTPTDFVSVIAVPYGGTKVPLTNDHAKARHAIESTTGQRAVGEDGSAMACRTRLVLESVENLLRGMAGRVHPTTVVLLTAGLAAPRRDAPMALAPGMCELQSEAFRRVAAAAGAARANFYIAQPDDVGTIGAPRNENISGVGFTGSDNPLAGIEDLAGITGGVRLPLTALGTSALDRVDRESAAYWVAEIDPQLTDFDSRSRRLEIAVRIPDATVRVRPEITFARQSTTAASRVTVSDMLMSTGSYPELPLRVVAHTLGTPDDDVQVVLVAETEPRGGALSAAGAVLVDGDGRVVSRWNAVDAGESPLVGAMRVPPGAYRLRVAAVDAGGRGGAADYRFDASLVDVGPLKLGSLILGLSRDGELTPRLEFGEEPSALASFEFYGGAEGMAVTAALEIAQTVDGQPLLTLPLAIRAQGSGRYLAMGTVPLGALPAGDYAVRGVLRLADGPSGRTIRTLRKSR